MGTIGLDVGITAGGVMLPIGQLLWEKELLSYREFPPLQAPETYNLDGILKAIQAGDHPSN